MLYIVEVANEYQRPMVKKLKGGTGKSKLQAPMDTQVCAADVNCAEE